MSDDLISRKDLLGTEQLLMSDIVKNNPTAWYVLEEVLYDIENTPTSYDVDKVIEKLEAYISQQSENEMLSDNGKWLVKRVIEECIKIVKSGGVTND